MKKGIIKRIIIAFLISILIIIGLIVFHYKFGLWWDRPSIEANDIIKIEVYEDQYGIFGKPPLFTLDGSSDDGKTLVKAINGGWHYPDLIKFGGYYVIVITNSDSNEVRVLIGNGCMSVRSEVDDRIKKYHDYKNIRKIIDGMKK